MEYVCRKKKEQKSYDLVGIPAKTLFANFVKINHEKIADKGTLDMKRR